MSAERAFVGEHTPVIAAGAAGVGLMQERLGLVEGRRYVGRVVIAGDAAAAPVRVSLVWGGGASDRQVVTIVIPEFVPARWWQHLLHNQTALLIKGALLFRKGVVVVDVPFHLR